MSLLRKVSANYNDLIAFGPQFLFRHSPRITGAKIVRVPIRGVGPIHLRAGESDILVVRQVFSDRSYEMRKEGPVGSRIFKRYQKILADGQIPAIVDAGANIGAAAVWFLKEFPLARVVAVEPEPGNVAVLRENAKDYPNIIVEPAAIGSSPGFVSVHREHLSWGTTTTRAEAGIPVVTVADAFQRVSNGRPFIVKIDIEGFEDDLFSRNFDWLADVYAVFIESHDWLMPGRLTSRTFQKAMAQHDFEIFIRGENLVYVRTD